MRPRERKKERAPSFARAARARGASEHANNLVSSLSSPRSPPNNLASCALSSPRSPPNPNNLVSCALSASLLRSLRPPPPPSPPLYPPLSLALARSRRYYAPIVKAKSDGEQSILDVTAIVLANLCVAYIMTSQNEDAEELMRKIEKEEEHMALQDPDKQFFHLCIVNLVIGTLYCAKGNYEFGISRICKSLEPYERKLGPDTWYYAKRCFLALAENMAKQMLILKDTTLHDILSFLDAADAHGAKITTVVDQEVDVDGTNPIDHTTRNVSWEARQLKRMFMNLRGN